MPKVNIREMLDGKWQNGTRPKDIFLEHVTRNPSTYVGDIIAGLKSRNRRVQSGCAEIASLLSEVRPQLLYQHIQLFQDNLNAEEPVLRWEAVCTLGNMVAVDKDQRIRENIEKIASFLNDKSIVLQAHAVRALSKIAIAFPDLRSRILERLLNSADKFPGNRIGFIVEAMKVFVEDEELLPKVVKFVEPHTQSEIKSVAVKARGVLKDLQIAT